MSVNQADQDLNNRLINTVEDLQRQVLDLRTKQKIGADSISMAYNNSYLFGPITILAAARSQFVVTTTPSIPILALWNFEFTVYVDSNGLGGFQFPNGTFLTGGKEKMRMSYWPDWANSNDSVGVRANMVVIENLDTVSHNYYLRFGAIVPTLPIGG